MRIKPTVFLYGMTICDVVQVCSGAGGNQLRGYGCRDSDLRKWNVFSQININKNTLKVDFGFEEKKKDSYLNKKKGSLIRNQRENKLNQNT